MEHEGTEFEGMMGPIPIKRSEPLISNQEREALDKARHERRMQWGFLTVFGLIALGLTAPLVIWLIRLALGA